MPPQAGTHRGPGYSPPLIQILLRKKSPLEMIAEMVENETG